MLTFNFMKLRTVTAIFPHGSKTRNAGMETLREYEYFIPEGDDPKIGDLIATSVAWSLDDGVAYDDEDKPAKAEVQKRAWGATTAKVVRVNDAASDKANKFYLALMPLDGLMKRYQSNLDLVDRVKEAKAAKAKLDELVQQRSMLKVYEELAATNPEARALLNQLTGGKAPF